MSGKVIVEIGTEPLNLNRAIASVSGPEHGAVDTFIGAVRNTHQGRDVVGIYYDVHDVLAKKRLEDICGQALEIWPDIDCYVSHFKGDLPVGGVSIIIAVAAPHRAESFDACRYIIEEIKKSVPVWKREYYLDGESDWLPGHSLGAQTDAGEKRYG